MDKTKLFLVALAPAALIVPMEVQAAETAIVKITGNNLEGAVLTADTSLIPKDKTITNYQWYYDEGIDAYGKPKFSEIQGAIASTLTIPVNSANKTIIVKVTTQDGTEYISEKVLVNNLLPTSGDTFINGKRFAEINNTPDNPVTIKSYQWYYVDNGKKTLIKGATDIEITIPIEAAGKPLIVEAKSEDGKAYTSQPITIEALQLSLDTTTPLKIKGYSPEKFVLPGDSLTVVNPNVKDGPRDLKSNQVTYAYQWMYEIDSSYSFITGATGATYNIPADALEKKMNKIVVRVTVTVGTPEASLSAYSEIVEVANSPAEGLVVLINDLLQKNTNNAQVYKSLSFDAFGSELENLMNKYTVLTSAAKANVTNYEILKRAGEDYKVVKSLKDRIKDAKNLNSDAKLQLFKTLDAEYTKLDLLQRSIDMTLYTDIQSGLGNASQNLEISEVIAINKLILELLDITTSGTSYTLVKYKGSIPELQQSIKTIEDRIAKLSGEYKSTVQNLDILNTAKADIKKVQAFLDKANKIENNTTAKKQVAAAKSIRTAYEKLNVKQQSLVPTTLFESDSKLTKAETAEEQGTNEIQDIIDQYITLEPTVEYKGIDTTEDVKEINKAITMYKALTKDNAKKVTGYAELLQLQKDIKKADGVSAKIEKYKILLDTEGISYSKLNSTYNSTLSAFNKLTTLQKSLVKNSDNLIAPLNNEQPPGKPLTEKEENAKALGTDFSSEIDRVLGGSKSNFSIYAIEIENLSLKYKGLSSARKYVTNYNEFKEAEKDVKAVQSFLKKVQAADIEADLKKRYTKIQSVQKAFSSLSANQQELAKTDETYNKLIESLKDDTIYMDLGDLDQRIASLLDGNTSIEEIKELESMYKNLSSAEKKKVINYSILKQAIADVKKVESFIAQYNKMLDNPKNAQSVIKAFNGLTAQQANLVPSDIQNAMIKLEVEQRESNDIALDLVEKINGLVVSGEYVAGLENEVGSLRNIYNGLSPAQQSLVKNYSKLTKAENDLAKVAEVYALEVAITNAEDKQTARKDWQKAYNKLSNQLEKLYLQSHPNRIE